MEDTTPVTPGPDTTPIPATMLSGGGMQGPPPQVDTTPQPNVQSAPANELGAVLPPQTTQPPDPSTGAASDPAMVAAGIHHKRLAESILNALGGPTTMHIVQQPDGSIIAQQVDATKAEKWSRIARAALSGAAAGFANGQGPGGAERAAAAGIQTGMAMPQAQQDQTMQKAQELEGQRQKQVLFNKNMAMLDLQYAKQNLENMQSPGKFDAAMAKSADEQRKAIEPMHGKLLATYTGPDSLNDHMQANQELLQKMVGVGGHLIQIPTYSGGKQTGVEVYGIPENIPNEFLPEDMTVTARAVDPDLKGMHDVVTNFPKGKSTWAEYIAGLKKAQTDTATAQEKFAQLTTGRMTAQAEQEKADTDKKESVARMARDYAEAAKANADASDPKLEPLTGEVSSRGIPLMRDKHGNITEAKLPEGMTAVRSTDRESFIKNTLTPAIKVNETYNLLKQFDANVQKGIVNPPEQREAVRMSLRMGLGLSPTGTGGRGGQTDAAFEKALKDRGIVDSKIALIEGALNGAKITPRQSADILRTANAIRYTTWREAAMVGAASGLKPDDVVPANVLGRPKIMAEIYGQQPGTGNTSQAARAPGAEPGPTPQPGQNQQQNLPQALPSGEVRTDGKGNYSQLQGNKWVAVAPPQTR